MSIYLYTIVVRLNVEKRQYNVPCLYPAKAVLYTAKKGERRVPWGGGSAPSRHFLLKFKQVVLPVF